MFNKENKIENIKDAETIIGPSVKVKGNFQGKGNIIIDGHLEGSLKTSSNLLVGEKASLNANIEAVEASINGSISGNITIKKYLALGKTAKITGDIVCSEISISRGAHINGKLIINSEQEIKTEKTIDKNNN
jgi:cytoskeletal protein CcmA (bactofilin family)